MNNEHNNAPAVNNWQSIKLVPPVPSKVIRSGLNALGHLFDTAPISDGQRAHWLTWSKDVRAMLTREEDATPATALAQEVGLTDEEIEAIAKKHMSTVGDHWCNEDAIRERHAEDFAHAIISALRAKGGKL